MSQTSVKNSMACQSDKEGHSVVGTQQSEDILSPNAQEGCVQAPRMINMSYYGCYIRSLQNSIPHITANLPGYKPSLRFSIITRDVNK